MLKDKDAEKSQRVMNATFQNGQDMTSTLWSKRMSNNKELKARVMR
jgi:hypothetical protein